MLLVVHLWDEAGPSFTSVVFVHLHWLLVDDQQMAGEVLGNSAPFPNLYPFGTWRAILMSLNRASIVKGAFQKHSRGSVEKAMAPHSSTLAWKTPWMEEPGRLQSMGSLRVRHN